jgi:hypothetical protein
MVTGFGPHLNVMTPPLATALTTAAEVQPAGVPLPMTWFGWLVFTGPAACGTNACPSGLPAAGSACASAWLACLAGPAVTCVAFTAAVFLVELDAVSLALRGDAAVAQAVSPTPAAKAIITTAVPRMSRMGPNASVASNSSVASSPYF